jgi:hypothetical protein
MSNFIKVFIAAFIFSALCAHTIAAQDINLTGTVKNSGAVGIAGARVGLTLQNNKFVNSVMGDSLYDDPLFQYGAGLQGWK